MTARREAPPSFPPGECRAAGSPSLLLFGGNTHAQRDPRHAGAHSSRDGTIVTIQGKNHRIASAPTWISTKGKTPR